MWYRLLLYARRRVRHPPQSVINYATGDVPVRWLDPWWPTGEQGDRFHELFAAQLRLEICDGDPIYGVAAKILGRGQGDDALFELLDGTGRVAFVHLQWGTSGGCPDDKFRTRSRVYETFEAFYLQHMLPEHREWVADRED